MDMNRVQRRHARESAFGPLPTFEPPLCVRRVPPAALQRLWFSLQTPPSFLGAPEACRDLPVRASARTPLVSVAENQTVGARQALPAGGDFCGGAERSLGVGARSAHPHLTRRVCLSRVSEANAASSAARLQGEHHSEVGAKRRPPQHEPPAGSACRAAPAAAHGSGHVRTAAMGRKRAMEIPR